MRTILTAVTLSGMALASAASADAKTSKIGISMLTQNAPYYAAVQQEAKALGAQVVAGFTVAGQGWGAWTQEGGVKAMEDLLTAHPDINAVLAENDSIALGAMRAIQDAGRADRNILIFAAADGQKEAVKLIEDGKYGATGLNDPAVIGKMAADLAVKAANKQVPAGYPKITFTPPVAITKANAAQHYKPAALF